MAEPKLKDLGERVGIVLHRPRLPENIGACARAMWNMGLSRLLLVGPVRWDEPAMYRMATREAAHVIRDVEVYDSLEAALSSYHLAVGTTARTGGLRGPLWPPWTAAQRIISLGHQDRVAMVFGPEDRGLSNEELKLCQITVRIPTASFSSLNLAQAVLIMCYELFKAAMSEELGIKERHGPLATIEEIEAMYEHLEDVLVKICAIPESNRKTGMMKVRRFLSRITLRPHEVRMIRGLCRQIEWYGSAKRRQEEEGGPPRADA